MNAIWIKWLDTATYAGWQTDADKKPLSEVVTVGFKIFEDDKVLRIAHSVSEDGDLADVTVLLKSNIVERYELGRKLL